jgi:hypothetical protein
VSPCEQRGGTVTLPRRPPNLIPASDVIDGADGEQATIHLLPLRHHFEQNFHVRHRLERYGAGDCIDFETATPEMIAQAIADAIVRAVDYRPVETDGAARAACTDRRAALTRSSGAVLQAARTQFYLQARSNLRTSRPFRPPSDRTVSAPRAKYLATTLVGR